VPPAVIHWENIHRELVRSADPYAASFAEQARRHARLLPPPATQPVKEQT
jgi:hypothetical protein